jgi:type II secretory pathway pseudopilin PulG
MNTRQEGFTVLEVMLSLTLGAVVFSALLVVSQGVTAALRQAQALDALSSTARHVRSALAPVAAAAGAPADPLADASLEAVSGSRSGPDSDRWVIQGRSPRNCFENSNPARGPDGQPAWWLRREEYSVRDGWQLVRSCFYGPPFGPTTRQLNAATIVEGVETLRLRFGLDTDGDRRLDRWVAAESWEDERHVIGVRIGLVLATEHFVGVKAAGDLSLFGNSQSTPDDGRARQTLILTFPIQGRL